jgi:putative phosphoribosyl transferase
MNTNLETSFQHKAQEGPIPAGRITLHGELVLPAGAGAKGIVLFAHGSGSSRHSPRNQQAARILRKAGLGTLLFDLLTAEEEEQDMKSRHLRFDIALLAQRLVDATTWISGQPQTQHLRIGYFGCSTGAAAALVAAAQLGDKVEAVVSRGGRPDLAGPALPQVRSATLLIVGERDEAVMGLNEQAFANLSSTKEIKVVPGATHLFEEPGTLEEAARLAADWFDRHLQGGAEKCAPALLNTFSP